MGPADNPYADALDGLQLEDPVAAFFDFCREREQIRIRRARGEPAPWTQDPIFQRGRFLNVFREDDRGSQAILRFAAPVAEDLPALIQALFFARWSNRQSTLDALSVDLLTDPERLRAALAALPEPPWCNVTAYPVEPLHWQGTRYGRLEAATTLFNRIQPDLVEAITGAQGNVVKATAAVNARFGMQNDFPIFMAVMDLAWFRPDVIDPASPVPTGIGAVAFLDRLQAHLGLDSHRATCERMIALQADYWPEAKRAFAPIDIEYLSCECRKYYSYVNGTKSLVGKNVFHAGRTARLGFDLELAEAPEPELITQIHIIAGGPCSGKTTLLNALADAGYRVEVETAERLLKAGIEAGRTAQELRADPLQWQQELLRQDHALFHGLPGDELLFADTSFIETLVFGERAGMELGPNLRRWLRHKRYRRVFFLEPLEGYEQSAVRMESQDLARQISAQVRLAYEAYGYELIPVPATPVPERLAFIESFLEQDG